MRRHLLRLALATTALTAAALLGTTGNAAASTTASIPLPNSMASTGDSISRAFDVNWGCFLSDCPADSWSTGNSSSVTSQYQRILTANPAVSGHEYNDAATGAKMNALDGQLKSAAGQGVQYATVLMGANDLCTSSASTMTTTATFQAEFTQAMADFTAADPAAHVFVSSIPNIYQLWQVLHTNSSAQATWSSFGICQSMLSSSNTEADRQLVVAQEQADNQVLASVCAQYSQCRWDNGATYATNFPASDVSTVDYFHPDIAGQNLIAATTWRAGYWPSTP